MLGRPDLDTTTSTIVLLTDSLLTCGTWLIALLRAVLSLRLTPCLSCTRRDLLPTLCSWWHSARASKGAMPMNAMIMAPFAHRLEQAHSAHMFAAVSVWFRTAIDCSLLQLAMHSLIATRVRACRLLATWRRPSASCTSVASCTETSPQTWVLSECSAATTLLLYRGARRCSADTDLAALCCCAELWLRVPQRQVQGPAL